MARPSRREALALLYERHSAELVQLAFAMTSDWGLAEELVQEAFVLSPDGWSQIERRHRRRTWRRAGIAALCSAWEAVPVPSHDLTAGAR
jgi:DNA-directed RNA polymerase specialized sigma24 family protein